MELVKPYIPEREYFVEISAVKRIRDGINYAMNFGEPVHIVSDTGFGKTTALYYIAEEMESVYCHAGQAHKTNTDMYRMLLLAFGIYHDSNYARDLFASLIRGLERSSWRRQSEPRRLLIVDECQTLEATTQRELLNIQETCDLALVIAGNGSRLAKSKIDPKTWKQIDHRIGMTIKLPSLSRDDCNLMGSAWGVEGLDAYDAIANFGTRTTARDLGRLLRNAKVLAGCTGAIRLQHIKTVLAANPGLGDVSLLRPEAA